MAKNVEDLTCLEAAKIFKYWSRQSQFRENASCLRAQAQILKCFGDQKVPAALHELFNFEHSLEHGTE